MQISLQSPNTCRPRSWLAPERLGSDLIVLLVSEAPAARLPADLLTAESDLLVAVSAAMSSGKGLRWSATLRFENLRLMPVALRLAQALKQRDGSLRMLWPDAGAAALARRDAPALANAIADFNQWSAQPDGDALLMVVGPQPSDYDPFMALCQAHRGPVVMLNGRLEDAAVGIGSVARERRRGFMASWQQAYWVQPLDGGALLRTFPADWHLFRLDPDGYRFLAATTNRPDPEQLSALLAGDDPDGLKQQLGSVDRFIEGLRN